jgi:cobyrinic acid a,c-diamide synthase
MSEDNDGLFSHEDRMRLGARHMGLMDAVEDPDLQQHMTDAHEALQKARRQPRGPRYRASAKSG